MMDTLPLMLAVELGAAGDLLERASSSLRVQNIVRLSMAPAFLLAGIGAMMNVIVARLTWVATRIERAENRIAKAANDSEAVQPGPRDHRELERLLRRRRLAQRAMILSTGAASVIAMVIALLFVSAFITTQIGAVVAFAFIGAMGLLIAALVTFVLETMVAASGQRDEGEIG